MDASSRCEVGVRCRRGGAATAASPPLRRRTGLPTVRSLLEEIAYFLHHQLRNIGTLSEILDESSEDNLLQTLRSSRAKALKSLPTLLDSVLQ